MPVELLIPLGFRPHSSQGIQLFFLAKWYYFIMMSKKIRSRFLGKGNLYWCSYMELDLLPWALQSSTTRQPCLRRTSLIFRGDLYVPNLWSSTWSGSRGASGGRVGSIGISFICPQSQWGALVESVLEKKSLFCLSHWIATWQHLWLWTVMTKAMCEHWSQPTSKLKWIQWSSIYKYEALTCLHNDFICMPNIWIYFHQVIWSRRHILYTSMQFRKGCVLMVKIQFGYLIFQIYITYGNHFQTKS